MFDSYDIISSSINIDFYFVGLLQIYKLKVEEECESIDIIKFTVTYLPSYWVDWWFQLLAKFLYASALVHNSDFDSSKTDPM